MSFSRTLEQHNTHTSLEDLRLRPLKILQQWKVEARAPQGYLCFHFSLPCCSPSEA